MNTTDNINHEKGIYEKEKIARILNVCTFREKEFISLYLKDLNLTDVRIAHLINKIKIKCKTLLRK